MTRQLSFCTAIAVAALLAAAGCSTRNPTAASPQPSASTIARSGSQSANANGRSIFQTGRDDAGVQIVARKPPLYPSCAACHTATGAGGMHLPGGAVSADLRHAALVIQQRPPYTLALLERAISTGIDNKGKPLDPVMPRWKLSQRDLRDVSQYVLTQLK